jgi:Trk K+ transport system NAD-binding subunit
MKLPAGPDQGSSGSAGGSTTSWRARLRYRFDNALARGPMVIIAYLAILSVVVMVVAAVIAFVADFTFGGANGHGFAEELWQSMLRTLDAGSFAADVHWPTRLLGLAITLTGIFLAGSLIGLIANAVDQRVEDLRRGHGPVIESGHTLILGWSPQVPRIISELVIANESERSAAVVVLARGDKTAMEQAVREQIDDTRSTRVVCRSGNPGLPDDLRRVGVTEARSIIAVRDEDGDAGVVKAVLGVRAVDPTLSGAHIVAELTEADNARTLQAVTGGAVLTVSSDDVVAEVAAQACLRSGLAAVFADLLDFDGCELYFTPAGELGGHAYRDSLLAYETSAVIGRLTADGSVELNPDGDAVLAPDDQLIVVAEDDSTIVCTGVVPPPPVAAVGTVAAAEPVRVLVVGWSGFGAKVLRELDEFLPAGSHIEVRLDPDLADADAVGGLAMEHATLEVHLDASGPDALLALGGHAPPDQVVVLGYRDSLSVDDADARTLLTLLALRATWPAAEIEHVRIVAELLDQRNLVLADPVGADDLIVSDALTSLLMAQLSEHAELHAVFEELFDADGASVELLPAPTLVGPEAVSFATIVTAAAAVGASAFGYRRAGTGEVMINPAKATTVALGADDQVIVIADRWALRARITGGPDPQSR